MISSLLPDGAVAVEAYGDRWETVLLPEERQLVATAVEKRWREFAAGRNCARRALTGLGWPDFPVLSGANREPLWPPGVLGSITHCQGYCAAAAARVGGIRGLGIDAEVNARLPDGVVDLVFTPRERRSLAEAPGLSLPALVFSAKESVYKAWFPIAGCWLGYQDAEIDFDIAASRFNVRLLPSAPLDDLPARLAFAGRFAASEAHVFTVVTATVPRPANYLPRKNSSG
jgi:4'-phosphopantetheinyl transferase EntD